MEVTVLTIVDTKLNTYFKLINGEIKLTNVLFEKNENNLIMNFLNENFIFENPFNIFDSNILSHETQYLNLFNFCQENKYIIKNYISITDYEKEKINQILELSKTKQILLYSDNLIDNTIQLFFKCLNNLNEKNLIYYKTYKLENLISNMDIEFIEQEKPESLRKKIIKIEEFLNKHFFYIYNKINLLCDDFEIIYLIDNKGLNYEIIKKKNNNNKKEIIDLIFKLSNGLTKDKFKNICDYYYADYFLIIKNIIKKSNIEKNGLNNSKIAIILNLFNISYNVFNFYEWNKENIKKIKKIKF
jgi:hypothetical protein